MKKLLFVSALLGLIFGMRGMVMAEDTATFDVTATVDEACVVGTTTNMAFGSLAATILDATTGKITTNQNKDASATFYQACTNGTTGVEFKFKGAELATFKMSSTGTPADQVTYHLWADAYTTNQLVADTVMTSVNFAGFKADGTDAQLTVYGRVVGSENTGAVVHADYTDTVTVTVTY
jgi:spore coat protein U-like protein